MIRDLYHVLSNNPNTFEITPKEMKATKYKSFNSQQIRIVATRHLDEWDKE